jgi:hypothetical protein
MENFDKYSRYLSEALAYNSGTQSLDDVKEKLDSGKYKMWTKSDAVAVTEICKLPNKVYMNIVLGGGNLEQLKQIDLEIEEEAKQSQYNGVMIVGRRGWLRVLPNFKEKAVVYIKEI